MVREGTVDSVDLAKGTMRFRSGDLVSGDIPWLAGRSGKTRKWSPVSVGEQGVMICPEGDTARGFFLPGIFSNAHPAPSGENVELVEYEDGARVGYDPAAHALTAILPAGGSARIEADGGLTIKGPVKIEGKLEVSETIGATGEITGNGVKLSKHQHGLVKAGLDRSGDPL